MIRQRSGLADRFYLSHGQVVVVGHLFCRSHSTSAASVLSRSDLGFYRVAWVVF
jgi:hypothetical protein